MRPSKNGDHLPEDGPSGKGPSPALPRVGCVIVTYRPEGEPLLRQIEAIRRQVDAIYLVDNGDGSELPAFAPELGLEVTTLGRNFGIAHAQNVGMDRARQGGADHILLLDQDSLPAPDMVAKLLEALTRLTEEGMSVAAVGPQYNDTRQGTVSPFVYRDGWSLKQRPNAPEIEHVPTDFLIASGCLIPVTVLDAIGGMEEALFIDYVDIEWALRAAQKGYRSFGIPAARMSHSLGDEWITWRGRRLPVHTPLRHYYYARNAILLARRSWIAPPWKFILLWRLFKQFVLFGIVVPGRGKHFRMMSLGIWHGILKRSGQL